MPGSSSPPAFTPPSTLWTAALSSQFPSASPLPPMRCPPPPVVGAREVAPRPLSLRAPWE
eukprot:206595-Lingulodinium_polyedra.AAC.1